MLKKKKDKKKDIIVEVRVKLISNGYTVGHYIDDDYDSYVTVYCATKADVMAVVEGLVK